METTKKPQARPVLKWAGGKTQLLDELLLRAPKAYGKYIEPFLGGGALFFALKPENAVIADSNPKLINMYQQIANNVDEIIDKLNKYHNSQEEFYTVREQNWMNLSKSEAAARMIYLNRTCFNGLYRVNRQGQFNVPFGKYNKYPLAEPEVFQFRAISPNTTSGAQATHMTTWQSCDCYLLPVNGSSKSSILI